MGNYQTGGTGEETGGTGEQTGGTGEQTRNMAELAGVWVNWLGGGGGVNWPGCG